MTQSKAAWAEARATPWRWPAHPCITRSSVPAIFACRTRSVLRQPRAAFAGPAAVIAAPLMHRVVQRVEGQRTLGIEEIVALGL